MNPRVKNMYGMSGHVIEWLGGGFCRISFDDGSERVEHAANLDKVAA